MANALEALIRNWTGAMPPPATKRRASDRWSVGAARPLELDLRVVRVDDETPTVKTFVVEPVSGRLAYEAGQHLTLLVDVDGKTERRCYSFSTSPLGGGEAAVTVRRIEGGKVSAHLHDHVRGGDALRAAPPSGAFTLVRGERRLVLVGGGVGVTPLVSLAETALRRDGETQVDFLCGHRSQDEIVLRPRLEALAREFAGRMRLRIALDHAPKGWKGLRGAMCGSRVLSQVDASADAYYVCGPEPMMQNVADALTTAGVDAAKIRIEHFAYAAPSTSVAPKGTREILLAKSGRRITAEPGQTILAAARKAGVELPFSCTMGGCGACKVKKKAGTVVAAEPNCLSEAEREKGYVLTCCSYAGDGLVLEGY